MILLFIIAPCAFASGKKGVLPVQLDNGLTLLIKEDHSQPLVTVQVWVKTGSVNETPRTAGLSHFLEHLIFKGTKLYPADEITRRTETQGGVINAATSKEFTQYYIDIRKEAVEDAVRILADAMENALLPAAEIDKERPVVIEEIRRHADNPGAMLYDLFSEAMFTVTPYRSSVIGSEEVIRTVSRKEIEDYYKKHYVPANMFVSIAGDVDAAAMRKIVNETFAKQPGKNPPPEPGLVEPPHESVSLQTKKAVEQAYWMAGFTGPTITSDDQFAGDITSVILGGGRSSRLFRTLREEKQIVYSIGTSFWSQRGSGVFAISGVFAPEKENETITATLLEIKRLADEGPTEEELRRAKTALESQWYFGKETFHDQASLYAYWHMQGNPSMVERYIEGTERVTAGDVKNFLKKYFTGKGFNQAILAPGK
ncbi:MAG: hypothetical protein A2219_04465 [Elusimicrobia bacterium RIFOXYA2_FULL_50_26]|nr:MAG: hypothetical protein A2219_04465 [Elusimicrobia bacterium RIFOXYA2_FULL_50_26]